MKLKYVDVLRGIAILGVLVVHCSQYGNITYIPLKIMHFFYYGANGVQLFYIASAFTLFLSMDKRFVEEKYPIRNFFIRRFFRIAPMYYIGICYYLWQDGFGPRFFLGDSPGISTGNILSNIFFIHGFSPYYINSLVPGGWSIAVEMFFYCFVPFLFIKIKNTQQAFKFFILSLIFNLVVFRILYKFPLVGDKNLWITYLSFYFPNQLPVFLLGILLYFVIKENYKINISPHFLLLTFILLIIQLTGLFNIIPEHVFFSGAFVILAIALSKYEFKLLINPVFIHLGKISYSMYLVHFAVLHWLNKFNFVDYLPTINFSSCLLNYLIRLFLLIVISTILSSFFYKWIEIPFQNIGKNIIKKWIILPQLASK